MLQNLERDFGLTPFDVEDIRKQIEQEGFKQHVCEYAYCTVLDRQRKGMCIRSPKGLLITIMRDNRDMPESPEIKIKHPKHKNPLAGDGYDFWFDGNRSVMDETCEAIIWGFDADDEASQQQALNILSECAPILMQDELKPVLRLATDYENKFGSIRGSYAARLAQATKRVVEYRVVRVCEGDKLPALSKTKQNSVHSDACRKVPSRNGTGQKSMV